MLSPDEKKYHSFSPKQKKVALLVAAFLFFVVLPPSFFFYYKFAVRRPSQTPDEITFEIKRGESLVEVSNNLAGAGAVNSEFLFTVYAKINGLDRNIQAGVYTIVPGSSVVELAELFQHGTLDNRVTFLEGWRMEEFALKASTEFENVDYMDFVNLSLERGLEGYLFPDTYILNRDITTEELVTYLENTFEKKTEELLSDAYLSKVGLTKEQAVIFASIVEREVRDDDERAVIAGILIKRWEEGIKIDADATTQYAVASAEVGCTVPSVDSCSTASEQVLASADWWPQELTGTDLALESPYNTRKVLGLPPTPISSVSLASLTAVVNPAPSEYYYYLNDTEGKTHYAVTLEEHEANAARYLRQ
jgi:UPF0755 protein